MVRRRFFRGVCVGLECGHDGVLPSSWWRMSAALVSVLVGHAVRNGVWCSECKAFCHPERIKRTVRLCPMADASSASEERQKMQDLGAQGPDAADSTAGATAGDERGDSMKVRVMLKD